MEQLTWDTQPTKSWEDNIKIGFKETGCEEIECIHLAQWFPKRAPQVQRDPRPVPRVSVDTFL